MGSILKELGVVLHLSIDWEFNQNKKLGMKPKSKTIDVHLIGHELGAHAFDLENGKYPKGTRCCVTSL